MYIYTHLRTFTIAIYDYNYHSPIAPLSLRSRSNLFLLFSAPSTVTPSFHSLTITRSLSLTREYAIWPRYPHVDICKDAINHETTARTWDCSRSPLVSRDVRDVREFQREWRTLEIRRSTATPECEWGSKNASRLSRLAAIPRNEKHVRLTSLVLWTNYQRSK